MLSIKPLQTHSEVSHTYMLQADRWQRCTSHLCPSWCFIFQTLPNHLDQNINTCNDSKDYTWGAQTGAGLHPNSTALQIRNIFKCSKWEWTGSSTGSQNQGMEPWETSLCSCTSCSQFQLPSLTSPLGQQWVRAYSATGHFNACFILKGDSMWSDPIFAHGQKMAGFIFLKQFSFIIATHTCGWMSFSGR